MEKLVRNPFVAGLLGGLVVAIVGVIAISAGLIKDKSTTTTVVQQVPSNSAVKDGSDKVPTVSEVYKKDGPGVVFIKAEISAASSGDAGPFGLPLPDSGGKQEATGSGFVIDDEGHILSNAHVVDDAEEVDVGLGRGVHVKAKVIGKDPSSDVALLKVNVDKEKLHPLKLGDSRALKVGDPVVAIGNPFGLNRTVTTGIVSALQRKLTAPNGFQIDDVIQTDASINPGNSGGPLLDAFGNVVGINSQIASQSGGSEGIGFAVPINTVKKELDQLKSKGSFDRAFLGVTGISLSSQLLKDLNLPADKGVLVQTVTKETGAEKAGIKGGDTEVTVNGQPVTLGGDIITKADGKDIRSMRQLVDLVSEKKPGDEIEVTIIRNKKEQTKTIKLGKRPDQVQQ